MAPKVFLQDSTHQVAEASPASRRASEAQPFSSASSSCSSESTNLQEIRVGAWKSPHMALSLVQQIPRSASGQLQLSLGSRAHPAECVPCIWHIRARGCFDGLLCRYCHADHDMSYQDRRRSQRQVRGPRDPPAATESSKGRGKFQGLPEGASRRSSRMFPAPTVHQDRLAGRAPAASRAPGSPELSAAHYPRQNWRVLMRFSV